MGPFRTLLLILTAALSLLLLAAVPAAPAQDCDCRAEVIDTDVVIYCAGGIADSVILTPAANGQCNQECAALPNLGCAWKASYKIGWPNWTLCGAFTTSWGSRSSVVTYQGVTYDAISESKLYVTDCGASSMEVVTIESVLGTVMAKIAFIGTCHGCAPKPPAGG